MGVIEMGQTIGNLYRDAANRFSFPSESRQKTSRSGYVVVLLLLWFVIVVVVLLWW
jgi:hypothetical protein